MIDGAVAMVFAGCFDNNEKEKNMITPDGIINGYSREIECFAPECINNIGFYCQCKPDNIAPNDSKRCGQHTVAKESK